MIAEKRRSGATLSENRRQTCNWPVTCKGADKLRQALAITSLGSPWWVDRFIVRQPVKRVLKTALLGTCAARCRFGMLSLYRAESLAPDKVQAFRARIGRALSKWA